MNDDEVALEVEKATPEFRSRLIAATQFGEGDKADDAAGVFVRALVKQTEEMAQPKNFNEIVSAEGFTRAFILALLVGGRGVLRPEVPVHRAPEGGKEAGGGRGCTGGLTRNDDGS